MRGRLGGATAALTVALALGAAPAQAAFVFSASGPGVGGGVLAAKAEFSVPSQGSLQIVLSNIATNDESGTQDVPGNTLTGVFFDVKDFPALTLTPSLATIAAGSLIQTDKCAVGKSNPCQPGPVTDVGGEFMYATGVAHARHGIASAGYIGGTPNFGGSNLDNPVSPDGINFGIISAESGNTYTPNGGLAKEPLIRGSVTFLLTGLPNTIGDSNIGAYILNVVFQYGTGLDEPCIGCSRVASPAALVLLAGGLVALAGPRCIRRLRAKQA